MIKENTGTSNPFNNLVVLEMANNHMGDYNHGLKMIHEFSEITKKRRKKYGDLDSLDNSDIPF